MAGPNTKVDPETVDDIPDEEWQDLEPERAKFEGVGETVEGTYLGKSFQTIEGDETSRHDLDTPEGAKFFYGSTTLDGPLSHVMPGDYIRVTYTGVTDKKYKGGNPAKLYKVQRRK